MSLFSRAKDKARNFFRRRRRRRKQHQQSADFAQHNVTFTEKQQKLADRTRNHGTVDGKGRLGEWKGYAPPGFHKDTPLVVLADFGSRPVLKQNDADIIREHMIKQLLIDTARENPVKIFNNLKKKAFDLFEKATFDDEDEEEATLMQRALYDRTRRRTDPISLLEEYEQDAFNIARDLLRDRLVEKTRENPVKLLNDLKKNAVDLARKKGEVGSQDKLATEGFLMLEEYEKDALQKAQEVFESLVDKIPKSKTKLNRYINKMSAKSRITETDQELINLANKIYTKMYGQRTLVADDFAYYDNRRPESKQHSRNIASIASAAASRVLPYPQSIVVGPSDGMDFQRLTSAEKRKMDEVAVGGRRRKTRRRKRKMKRKSKKHKKKRKQKKTKKRRKRKSKRKTKTRK